MGGGGLGWRRLEPPACARHAKRCGGECPSSGGLCERRAGGLVPAIAGALLDDTP